MDYSNPLFWLLLLVGLVVLGIGIWSVLDPWDPWMDPDATAMAFMLAVIFIGGAFVGAYFIADQTKRDAERLQLWKQQFPESKILETDWPEVRFRNESGVECIGYWQEVGFEGTYELTDLFCQEGNRGAAKS